MVSRVPLRTALARRGRLFTLALLIVFAVAASAPVLLIPTATAGSPVRAGHRASRWKVTALGDSVTAGTACDCSPFVEVYAKLTERATGVRVTTRNLGAPGQTAAELVASLASDADVASAVASSDIVLVTTGANDLAGDLDKWTAGDCPISCFQQQMPDLQADVAAIVARIQALRAGRPTEILVTNYWNVFRDGDVAAGLGADYGVISQDATQLANTAICAGARSAGATCVDLYKPFKGDGSTDPTPLLADDGDHPDAAGHQVIAEALAAHGWQELLP
jgi:lysophospholipase L1-like esterase